MVLKLLRAGHGGHTGGVSVSPTDRMVLKHVRAMRRIGDRLGFSIPYGSNGVEAEILQILDTWRQVFQYPLRIEWC